VLRARGERIAAETGIRFSGAFLHLISSTVLRSSANAVTSEQWSGKAEADPSHRSPTAGDRVRDDKALGWCPKSESPHTSRPLFKTGAQDGAPAKAKQRPRDSRRMRRMGYLKSSA
jgi:hypothetical protein